MDNQHLVMWHDSCNTQRQPRKLISGPSPTTKNRFLSFNKTQSRFVIGLLTVYNTLGTHIHLTGLTNSTWCRRCGTEEQALAHILCECEALASLRHTFWAPFFDLENTEESKSRVHLDLQRRSRAPLTLHQIMRHNRPVLMCIGTTRARTKLLI